MNAPVGVTDGAWEAAVAKAATDRATVRRLVAEGKLRQVGKPAPSKVNLAIRPKKKRRK